jgi:hypothetical protein
MAGLNLFTNNAATTLASAINSTVTSLTVASSTGALFPTLSGSQYFYCTLANNAGTVEIVKVTARSTDTFTIVRGQDGTSAVSWSSGDKVELRLTRVDLLNFPQLDSTNTFADTQTFSVAPVFTNQSGTRTAMSAAASGANSDITSITGLTTALTVAQGGTGNTTYTNGQLLIGNTTGNTLTKATLTAGTGISVTNSTGSITIANTLSGGFQNMQVFTAPGTFTTPATTTQIKITVVGGGGAGGCLAIQGGGGGGGGAAIYVGPVTASTPYAVTVGASVAGVAGPSTAGTSGNTSSFGALASATGGTGGPSSPSKRGGAGGAGSAGTILFTGQSGGDAVGPNGPTVFMNGGGGGSLLGQGGFASSNFTSVNGIAYGGGGGGQVSPGPSGSGAAGVVIVEY